MNTGKNCTSVPEIIEKYKFVCNIGLNTISKCIHLSFCLRDGKAYISYKIFYRRLDESDQEERRYTVNYTSSLLLIICILKMKVYDNLKIASQTFNVKM